MRQKSGGYSVDVPNRSRILQAIPSFPLLLLLRMPAAADGVGISSVSSCPRPGCVNLPPPMLSYLQIPNIARCRKVASRKAVLSRYRCDDTVDRRER